MNDKNLALLSFSVSAISTGAAIFYLTKKFEKKYLENRREDEVRWIATGIIRERIRNGRYRGASQEELMMEFQIEKIEIENDDAYNKIDRSRKL